MNPEVSIVPVDKRPYRKIAQEHWGLSNEQMEGMHVHHRIPRSKGGTNDVTNLYVCSPWFHAYVWHTKQFWIETQLQSAKAGGKAVHRIKDERGKSVQASKNGKKMQDKLHREKNEEGKSKHAVKAGKLGCLSLHKEKTPEGKSKHAVSQFKEKDANGVPLRTTVMGMGRFRAIEVLDIIEDVSFTFDQLIMASTAIGIPKTSLRRLADEEGKVYKNRFKARWWSSTF